MQTITQTIRLGILLIACVAVSACETMESFYEEVIVASVNETIIEPVKDTELSYCYGFKDTELSYCYGCDWIVQEFHGGQWETRNSQPYDTREECLLAKREQEDRDSHIHFRCIHESDLD
jgi:hypothetical protein